MNRKIWDNIARTWLIAAMFLVSIGLGAPVRAEPPTHGVAMHGAPALAPGEPLPYANPDAPQGGTITFGVLGSFDNLNPMIPRGTTAEGLRDLLYFGNLVYESLLERSRDEAFSLYGFLAEEVIVPPERDAITFKINPKAAFSDGEPVTAEDVVFTMELLREKGWPFQRSYYKRIESVETPDDQTVIFRFPNANDREFPLILGVMPILPAHATDPETFEKTTLTPPPGTGPYVIDKVDPGRALTFRRNPDYWGNDNPLNQGRYNAEFVRFLYYRDETTMFEAFKSGEIDAFMEADAGRWAQGYDFPAMRDGRIERWEIPTGQPRGMWAFAMNTRRAPFDDLRVRKAMNLLFDFEWVNRQMFFGLRDRTESFFESSELQSTGLPASDAERALLAPFAEVVPEDIMNGTWAPPQSDGSGRDRTNIRAALALLNEAGWRVDGGKLVDAGGNPFRFELLVALRDDERLALAYQRMLKPIGIEAEVRYVDPGQYYERLRDFDFDMIRTYWSASLSPGNEQMGRWSSEAADIEGTLNYAGVREPAVDAMVSAMLAATEREDFITAVRALDRVLLAGEYVVPLFNKPMQWIAYSTRLGHPDKQSLAGVEWETWWVKP
ncbi:extracellular solute-binding protein [Acuticoccus sp. MNP-M23]|uniref:extracellular solute-binding protein n=1 Tax=Acuticoccus sp. MNP-M23 TaxID=3072793 RepID=UPI002815505D|nr:extracellular solute-binding protein [Acuticoccus sp. MNP-M23]WMS42171.1 extracellular solute-binding protein [Acuticoccus sp. MNP-M23]